MIRKSWTIAVICTLLVIVGLVSRHQQAPEATPDSTIPINASLDDEQQSIRAMHEKNQIAGEDAMAVVRTYLERSPFQLAAAPGDLEELPPGANTRLARVAFWGTKQCAVSPDCKRLAVVTHRGITVYDLPSLAMLRHLPNPEENLGFKELRFLEDRLLLGIRDTGPHLFHIWDVESGNLAMFGSVGSEDPNQVKLEAGLPQIDEKTRLFVIHRNANRPDSYYEIWQTYPLQQLHVVGLNNGGASGWQLSADGSALVGWGHYYTRGATQLPEKKLAIVDTQTGKIRVWIEVDIGHLVLSNCAISRDGDRVAVGIVREKVMVYDTWTGTLLTTITCGTSQDKFICYDRQGRLVIVENERVRVVDDRTGIQLANYEIAAEYRDRLEAKVTARFEFPRLGSPLLYISHQIGDILELDTGKNLAPSVPSQSGLSSLTLSDDGKTLHTLDGYSRYQQWDLRKQAPAYPLARNLKDSRTRTRLQSDVTPTLSQDGKRIYSTSRMELVNPYRVEIRIVAIDTSTGRELYSNVEPPDSHINYGDAYSHQSVLNPSGKLFAFEDRILYGLSVRERNETPLNIRVRDAETGKVNSTLNLKNAQGIGIAFSPDERNILITSNDSNANVPSSFDRIDGVYKRKTPPVKLAYFDIKSGQKIREGSLSSLGLTLPMIAPDSRRVILVRDHQYWANGGMRQIIKNDTRLASWDLQTGEVRELPPAYYGSRNARPVLSPCGRFFVLVTMGDYEINYFGGDIQDFKKVGRPGISKNQAVRVFETSTLTQRFEWAWPAMNPMRLDKSISTIPDGEVGSLVISADSKTLATGMGAGTVLLCDMSPKAGPKPWVEKPSTLPALWEKFTHRDAEQGWLAMRELVGRPEIALPLLRKQVQPQMPGDKPSPELFAVMISALTQRDFKEREQATASLEKLGRLVEMELRQAIQEVNSPEAQDRLKRLLAKMKDRPEDFWESRAVEVLEAIDSQSSRDLLREWSKAESSTILARESQAALKRMSKD